MPLFITVLAVLSLESLHISDYQVCRKNWVYKIIVLTNGTIGTKPTRRPNRMIFFNYNFYVLL